MPIPDSIKAGNSSPYDRSAQSTREKKRRTSTPSPQRKVIFASEAEAVQNLENTARSGMNLPSSWSLHNPNEIVLLALQIELTQKFEKCFNEVQTGDKDSLEKMHQQLSAILHSASGLLQGTNATDHVHEVVTLEPSNENPDHGKEEASDSADLPRQAAPFVDARLVLSPSQIQKLTNLIFILAGKRDLAARLSRMARITDQNDNNEDDRKGDLSKAFEWQSQLKYSYTQSNASCIISVMDYNCEYGFEYQGTATRMINTPETDRALFWMAQGMSNYCPCLIVGSKVIIILSYCVARGKREGS